MLLLGRLIVEVVSPLNLSIIFFILAFVAIFFNKNRLSKIFLFLGLIVILWASYGIGVTSIIKSKENIYRALSDSKITGLAKEEITSIVVLGSGHISDNYLPATIQLGGAAQRRLVEGVRIHRLIPESKLILCGGKVFDPVPHAHVMRLAAIELGVSDTNIEVVDTPKDTMQEAHAVSSILEENKIIVVTSALHMPRAIEIFQSYGLEPIPAPTDYNVRKTNYYFADYFPSTRNIDLSKSIIYERIGKIWMLIKKNSKKFLS